MAAVNKRIDLPRYYKEVLVQGIRPDGRVSDEWRPMSINVKSFHNADGSAIVKIGNTTVVCGIKLEMAKPKAEAPDQGFLIPNVDLPPLCFGQYQPGPPNDYAQGATKFMDEILQSSACINPKELCIMKDYLCWVVYLDIICLNQDGSLLDACVAASVAALKSITFPKVTYQPENYEKIIDSSVKKKLTISKFPISTTFAVFESNFLLSDPTADEESLSSGIVTIVVESKTGNICGLHQPGSEPLRLCELKKCVAIAKKKSRAVAELINMAVQDL